MLITVPVFTQPGQQPLESGDSVVPVSETFSTVYSRAHGTSMQEGLGHAGILLRFGGGPESEPRLCHLHKWPSELI